MKPLCLVSIRNGKHAIRWPVLLARLAVYLVILGAGVILVTWLSDLIFRTHDLGNIARLVLIPGFLAILFVVYDVRRDLKLPLKDLPDLESGPGSDTL